MPATLTPPYPPLDLDPDSPAADYIGDAEPRIHLDLPGGPRIEYETVRRDLWGSDRWDRAQAPVLRLLFRHLLVIADPARMLNYQGDLMADALWLDRELAADGPPPDGRRLWFQPYDCGTNIGAVAAETSRGFPFDVLRRGEPGRGWWWVDLIARTHLCDGEPHARWWAEFTYCQPLV